MWKCVEKPIICNDLLLVARVNRAIGVIGTVEKMSLVLDIRVNIPNVGHLDGKVNFPNVAQ